MTCDELLFFTTPIILVSNGVIDKLEGIRKEVVVVYSRYYPSLWLEGFRETMIAGALMRFERNIHWMWGKSITAGSARSVWITWNHKLVNVFEKYPVRIPAQAPLVFTESFKEDSWTLDAPLKCIWGMKLKLHTILTSLTHSSSLHNHRQNWRWNKLLYFIQCH
jgi:hypothetical protein